MTERPTNVGIIITPDKQVVEKSNYATDRRCTSTGPVVVVGPLDGEGWDTDVTDRARRWIERVAREAKV